MLEYRIWIPPCWVCSLLLSSYLVLWLMLLPIQWLSISGLVEFFHIIRSCIVQHMLNFWKNEYCSSYPCSTMWCTNVVQSRFMWSNILPSDHVHLIILVISIINSLLHFHSFYFSINTHNSVNIQGKNIFNSPSCRCNIFWWPPHFMACHIICCVIWHVMPHQDLPCHIHVLSCRTTWCHVMTWHVIPCVAMTFYFMTCHVT